MVVTYHSLVKQQVIVTLTHCTVQYALSWVTPAGTATRNDSLLMRSSVLALTLLLINVTDSGVKMAAGGGVSMLIKLLK